MQTDHAVFHCHAVKKGLFVIKEVGVWEPKLVCDTIIQSQVEVQLAVGQTLISPTLLEIHCDGVVLREEIIHVLHHFTLSVHNCSHFLAELCTSEGPLSSD